MGIVMDSVYIYNYNGYDEDMSGESSGIQHRYWSIQD